MTSTCFRLLASGGLLLLQSSQSFALPDCPESGYRDNCFGSAIFASGSKYVGEFKDDSYNGQGIYTFGDGEKYVGEFKDGKFHEHGVYTYTNGDNYVGKFKNGKKNGRGLYTHADGTFEKGFFQDDRFLYESKVK
jgi:hypothetical protein